MKTFHTAIAAFALALSQAAIAGGPRVTELGHEAATSMVRLPTSESGELTLQGCDTCKVLRLRATPSTRYVIGEEPVTLAELTKYLQLNPDAGMLVAQINGTNQLGRIKVYVPPASSQGDAK